MTPARRTRLRAARVARLGIVAILFQAILFGWHHHDLVFAGSFPAPVVQNSAAPIQPAADADGCEICSVLHHLTAAPADLAAALPSPLPADILLAGGAAFVAEVSALGFQARAPPLV